MQGKSKKAGFTLIEVLMFIIVSGLLFDTLMMGGNLVLQNSSNLHKNLVAIETAQRCMEYFVQQIRASGNSPYYPCGQTITASQCYAPTGYTVSAYVSCTTWNADSNYSTLTVTVSGTSSAVLSFQFANFLS